MKHAFSLAFLFLVGRVSCQVCLDMTKTCTIRHELQLDFAYAFQWNCSIVSNCICLQGMDIIFYEFPPYVEYDKTKEGAKGLMPGLLEESINLCCYGCNKISYKKPIANLGAMFSDELANVSYTAIFPILATKQIKTYFAGPFISMMSTPGVSYVQLQNDNGESYDHLLDALSRTWPLLVLSVMLSLNAGFVIWLLDTRFNPTDFPRPFPLGALEGGWWAFVSMTTVGYGDKCPKFILSRLFAILWIVFGIALSGIFTASITTALTVSLSSDTVDLGRKNVGVLNVTRYEQNIALRENAIPVEFSKLEDMKVALKIGKVDGLLIDNNVLGYNWEFLKSGLNLAVNTKIANSDTTYGMMFQMNLMNNDSKKMVQNQAWADFLSSFFDYNKDNENIMLSLARRSLPRMISREPFMTQTKSTGLPQSVYELLFKQIGFSSCALFAIGVIYEVIRRICKKKKIDICKSGVKRIDSEKTKSPKDNDIEMDKLGSKADNLVHDLEQVLHQMKNLKSLNGKVDTRM